MKTTPMTTAPNARVDDLLLNGFAVVPRLVDDDTLRDLRAAYDDLVERRVASRGDRHLGGIIRQIKHPGMDHPTFAGNDAIRAATDIARAVFRRSDLTKVYDMLIDKPAGTAHATPWHQDVGYFGRPVAAEGFATNIPDIQVWLALDPADVDNGCMQFLPTPHGTPCQPHEVVSGDPDDESRLIALTAPVDGSKAIPCPLAPGGCTIHLLGTPHATGPNHTERPRRAYIFNIGLEALADAADRVLEETWGESARLQGTA